MIERTPLFPLPLKTPKAGSPPAGRAARGGVLPMSRRARAVPGQALPPAPAGGRSSREAV